MRLALILIYVIFISATGQTAQTAVSDDNSSDQINSLSGWDNSELLNNDCRNTQQTAIDSHSVTPDGCLLDDCSFDTQPETAFLTYDYSGTKRLGYFEDKWTKLASTGYHSTYARAEIYAIDSVRDGESADNPSPSNNYHNKFVSWIENAYHAWAAKDYYGSTGLLLLSFGLIGLIGIRRKFKKS